MKTTILMLGLIGLLMLAGCGQKGDLTHPEPAPPPTLEKSADK